MGRLGNQNGMKGWDAKVDEHGIGELPLVRNRGQDT